jgi:hypothetical protein
MFLFPKLSKQVLELTKSPIQLVRQYSGWVIMLTYYHLVPRLGMGGVMFTFPVHLHGGLGNILSLGNHVLCVICTAESYRSKRWHSGWGTALQTRRSWDRFPMLSLEFAIEIILPAALWPWGWCAQSSHQLFFRHSCSPSLFLILLYISRDRSSWSPSFSSITFKVI